MTDYLEFRFSKFIFRVATDRRYTPEGTWVKREGDSITIGMSDFLQQRSGDVAFAEVKPEGTQVAVGDELSVIETIKVNISLGSPVAGRVIRTNPALEAAPEIINQDPYGDGWLVMMQVHDMDKTMNQLLSPQDFFDRIKLEAGREGYRSG